MTSHSSAFDRFKPQGLTTNHSCRTKRFRFSLVTGLITLFLFTLIGCEKDRPSPVVTPAAATPGEYDVRAKAERGDASAQTALGKIQLEGRTAPPDYTQAALWFRKAAEQGSSDAQFYLAGLHEAGRGVQRDFSEAVRWNLKAAEAGNADAQYAVALLYATGKGTPKDKPASVKWFRAAAEQGLPEAQFNLAQRHQHGQGTATNLAEAYKWFAVAAKYGVRDAVKESQPLRSELSPAEISAAEKFAETFVSRPVVSKE